VEGVLIVMRKLRILVAVSIILDRTDSQRLQEVGCVRFLRTCPVPRSPSALQPLTVPMLALVDGHFYTRTTVQFSRSITKHSRHHGPNNKNVLTACMCSQLPRSRLSRDRAWPDDRRIHGSSNVQIEQQGFQRAVVSEWGRVVLGKGAPPLCMLTCTPQTWRTTAGRGYLGQD